MCVCVYYYSVSFSGRLIYLDLFLFARSRFCLLEQQRKQGRASVGETNTANMIQQIFKKEQKFFFKLVKIAKAKLKKEQNVVFTVCEANRRQQSLRFMMQSSPKSLEYPYFKFLIKEFISEFLFDYFFRIIGYLSLCGLLTRNVADQRRRDVVETAHLGSNRERVAHVRLRRNARPLHLAEAGHVLELVLREVTILEFDRQSRTLKEKDLIILYKIRFLFNFRVYALPVTNIVNGIFN